MNAISDTLYDIEVISLVYGGDAFGRLPDGRAVFVPFALPGERIRVQLTEEKRGHARGKLVEVIQKSEARIDPRCRHYGVCGGCHLQHMAYDYQLEIKTTILKEQLVRIAGIENPPVEKIVASPNQWHYRNAVQFHLDSMGKLGYLESGSHRVVAIQECFLPENVLNEIWPNIDLEASDLGIEEVGLRVGENEDVLLSLEGSLPGPVAAFELDLPISAVYNSSGGPILLAGDFNTVMRVHERLFQVSSQSFFQVNSQMASAMVDHILSILPINPDSVVLDLYCGVGLFSAFIAPHVKRCVGIELSESACEDFAVNLDGFDNVELYVGAAEQVLPSIDLQPNFVVVDPPRSGLDRKVVDELTRLQPELIAYVSCDPATLARDIKRFVAAGYTLASVTPFDLFPQTYHIESCALMSRVKE